jgi:hypothetical protein
MRTNGLRSQKVWSSAFILTVLVGLISLFSPSVRAQVGTSQITGTITDPSGAAIAGAKVSIKNDSTNIEAKTVTSTSGVYTVPGLPVGLYTVTVEAGKFQTVIVNHVRTDIGATVELDQKMVVGQVTQTVTVTGSSSELNTTSATVGTLITNAEIDTLPLNGRSWISINYLSPGASAFHGTSLAFSDITLPISPGNFVVNGLRGSNNTFLLDDASLVEHEDFIMGVVPPLDSLTEFRNETSNSSTEYSGGAGAMITAATKSGTNEVHGDVWEYLRNNALDTRQYFDVNVPELRRNQFGGTIGAPIRKDHTFIFGSYEGLRQVQGQTFVGDYPTAAQRAGNLSTLSSTPIINPLTGLPFPGNVIPSSAINPLSTLWLNTWIPLPNTNVPVGSGNSRIVGITPIDYNTFVTRVDERIGATSNLFGRYIITQTSSLTAQPIPSFTRTRFNRTQNATVDFNHSIGSTKMLDFRVSWNRWHQSEPVGNVQNANMLASLGVVGGEGFSTNANANEAPPGISVSGFSALGGGAFGRPRQWYDDSYYFDGSFTFTRGSHTLKLGYELQRFFMNFPEIINSTGSWSYDGTFSGLGLADFLLGFPRSVAVTSGPFAQDEWRWGDSVWLQDDWKVNHRLTVNLGIRYDYDGRWDPHTRRVTNYLFNTPPTAVQITAQDPPSDLGPALVKGRQNLFSPRVGLAYKLHGNTVLRAGYGIYFNPMTADPTAEDSVNPPWVAPLQAIIDPSQLSTFNRTNPLAAASGVIASPQATNTNWKDGFVQEYNLTIEHSVGANLFSIAYVGNKGTNLNTSYDINLTQPGPGLIQPRRPFTNIGGTTYFDTDRSSWYNSLQLQATRHFTQNLSLIASYAWQKTLDNGSGTYIEGAASNFQQPLNLKAEKAWQSSTFEMT